VAGADGKEPWQEACCNQYQPEYIKARQTIQKYQYIQKTRPKCHKRKHGRGIGKGVRIKQNT